MLLLFQDSVIVFAEYECFKMFFESGQCWCFSDIGWKFIPEPRSGNSERTFTKFKSCAWNNELTMFTEIYSCLRLWTRDIIDEAVRLVLYVDITYAQVKFYCILYISVISVDIVLQTIIRWNVCFAVDVECGDIGELFWYKTWDRHV